MKLQCNKPPLLRDRNDKLRANNFEKETDKQKIGRF